MTLVERREPHDSKKRIIRKERRSQLKHTRSKPKIFITNLAEINEDRTPSMHSSEHQMPPVGPSPAGRGNPPPFGVSGHPPHHQPHHPPHPAAAHHPYQHPPHGGPPNGFYSRAPQAPHVLYRQGQGQPMPPYLNSRPAPPPVRHPNPGSAYQGQPNWHPFNGVFRGRPEVFRTYPSPFPGHAGHPPNIVSQASSQSNGQGGRSQPSHPVYGAPNWERQYVVTRQDRHPGIQQSMSCPYPTDRQTSDMQQMPQRTPSFPSPIKNSSRLHDHRDCDISSDNFDGNSICEERSPVPMQRRSLSFPEPPTTTLNDKEKEGKKLVLTVSASPTHEARKEHQQTAQQTRTTNQTNQAAGLSSTAPDSPGPAFLSLMNDLNEQGELTIEEENFGLSSNDSFHLLPLLDTEEDQQRISPPMMPFLSKSPMLSWDTGDDAPGDADREQDSPFPGHGHTRGLILDPQSELSNFNGDGSQGIMYRKQCPQDQRQEENGQSKEKNDNSQREQEPSVRQSEPSEANSGVSSRSPYAQRHAILPPAHLSPFPSPTQIRTVQSLSPRTHAYRFQTTPSFATSPNPNGILRPPSMALPRRAPGPPAFPSTMPQNLASIVGESKGRCIALEPLPTRFQGDIEKCKDEKVPDFSTLVNFPNNATLRQNRLLPNGMRCCVMCGCIRPTCSRSRNRRMNDLSTGSSHSPGGNDPMMIRRAASGDYDDCMVTIPTQNKGLCTMCDIGVWVVTETGRQIKWCKGCKNFRPWAAFGDKGLATKCTKCRERQREKYAMLKDSKKRKDR